VNSTLRQSGYAAGSTLPLIGVAESACPSEAGSFIADARARLLDRLETTDFGPLLAVPA